MKKTKYKRKIKSIISLVIVISILYLNSFSLIASAYGGTLDLDGWDSISVYIRNVGNGKYITEPNGDLFNGKEVVLEEGAEIISQRWCVYDCGDGYYSFHSAWDEHYVLSIAGGGNVIGARIVLMYVSNVFNVPKNAQFRLVNEEDQCITYLQSKLSVEDSTRNVISYQSSTNRLNNENANDLYEPAVHQLWAFEDIERNIEPNSWDLVDIGGHCDWKCSSNTYMDMVERATVAWNDYIGDEVFRVDTILRIRDVEINDMDTDPTGKGSLARTHSSNYTANKEYASTIYFFKNSMDLLKSDLQRQKTVMHELGHALGLNENRESQSDDKLGNIMQQGGLPYGTFISLDDKASVEQAYAGF